MVMHRRALLSALNKKVVKSIEETEEARLERLAKKQAKKHATRPDGDAKDQGARGDTPDFSGFFKPDSGQTAKSDVGWFDVHEWFREGIMRNNKKWLVCQPVPYRDGDDCSGSGSGVLGWCHPEKKCARMLLVKYGAGVVEKVVGWYCDNWDALKKNSDGRLIGAPSVRLLWASRDMFFSEEAMSGKKVKVKKPKPKPKKHMVGEYDAERSSKSPRVGWRKDV